MNKYKGVYKILMKKWIPTIFSEIRGFSNWEGVLGLDWQGVK